MDAMPFKNQKCKSPDFTFPVFGSPLHLKKFNPRKVMRLSQPFENQMPHSQCSLRENPKFLQILDLRIINSKEMFD